MSDQMVLCVDGSETVDSLASTVRDSGDYETMTVTAHDEVVSALEDHPVTCVVTGYEINDGFSGLDVAEAIRTTSPQIPCLLYTEADVSEIDTSEFDELVVEFLDRERPNAEETLKFLIEDLINHAASAQVGHLTPDDEFDRLAELEQYEVDELPIEETLDRVSGLISDHLDAPVTFVGLVKREQEEFIGCAGGDFQPVTREDTMCTHAILQEDVMTVSDIREDKRFSENEVLHNLGVRAYAGANLTTPNGHVIGSVCMLDTEPREFSEKECDTLQRYADTVMELLELRRAVAENDDAEVVQGVAQ